MKKNSAGDGGFRQQQRFRRGFFTVLNVFIPMNLIIPKENLGTLTWRLLFYYSKNDCIYTYPLFNRKDIPERFLVMQVLFDKFKYYVSSFSMLWIICYISFCHFVRTLIWIYKAAILDTSWKINNTFWLGKCLNFLACCESLFGWRI